MAGAPLALHAAAHAKQQAGHQRRGVQAVQPLALTGGQGGGQRWVAGAQALGQPGEQLLQPLAQRVLGLGAQPGEFFAQPADDAGGEQVEFFFVVIALQLGFAQPGLGLAPPVVFFVVAQRFQRQPGGRLPEALRGQRLIQQPHQGFPHGGAAVVLQRVRQQPAQRLRPVRVGQAGAQLGVDKAGQGGRIQLFGQPQRQPAGNAQRALAVARLIQQDQQRIGQLHRGQPFTNGRWRQPLGLHHLDNAGGDARAAVDHNIGVPRQPGNGDAVKQRRHGKPVGQAADGGAFGRVAGNLPGRVRQPAGGVQRFQRQQAAGSQAERGAAAMAGQPVSQWGSRGRRHGRAQRRMSTARWISQWAMLAWLGSSGSASRSNQQADSISPGCGVMSPST